jgi:hypothetical protein
VQASISNHGYSELPRTRGRLRTTRARRGRLVGQAGRRPSPTSGSSAYNGTAGYQSKATAPSSGSVMP